MSLPETATRTEFARILGCRPSYVTELGKAGRLVLTANGRRVRVAESIARIEATRDPAKAGVAARHAAARAARRTSAAAASRRDAGAGAPSSLDPSAATTSGQDNAVACKSSQDTVAATPSSQDTSAEPITEPLDFPPDSASAERRARALADKEEALARRAQRENLLAEGQLAHVGEVVGGVAAIVTSLRTALESMPDQLAPQLAATTDEARIRVLLAEHLEHLMASASRDLHQLGQPGRGDQA